MEFKDRNPTKPNRFRVLLEDGTYYYAVLERADEPTEIGTPLNAETLNGLLQKTGGELTGELIVNENFHVKKSFDGIPYRSYLRPVNYALDGEYTTALIHYNNGTNDAQLAFNKNGVLLRDNVNKKSMPLFGQHNIPVAATSLLHRENAVHQANTDYTTLMARGTSINSEETNPAVNGAICWTYK